MRNLKILLLIISIFMLFSTSCDETSNSQSQGEASQENVMMRAMTQEPVPEVNNFLTRKAVVKWIERMDTPDKLFYIYVLADNGAKIGYFVAQYRPVSTSTFLTPTKRIEKMSMDYGKVLPAPSLDGTYYGEGGASAQYFFFDAETDAFIELKGLNYILMDQPLAGLEIPRLRVDTQNENN